MTELEVKSVSQKDRIGFLQVQLEKQMKHKQKLNVISRKASLGDTILCIIMPYYFEKQLQAPTWNLRLHVLNLIRDLIDRQICPFYSRYILGKESPNPVGFVIFPIR